MERTWDDEALEQALSDETLSLAGLREMQRRASIRLERREYGELHDASWYESRQTEEQWLAEVGATE